MFQTQIMAYLIVKYKSQSAEAFAVFRLLNVCWQQRRRRFTLFVRLDLGERHLSHVYMQHTVWLAPPNFVCKRFGDHRDRILCFGRASQWREAN